jgi:hypothetical protein
MTIRSDRGTQFVNDIIKELLDLLQVEHERIMNAKVHDTIGVSPAKLLFGKLSTCTQDSYLQFLPSFFISGLDNAAPGRLFNLVAKLVKAQHTLIEAFVDYCRENKLSSLVSKRFKVYYGIIQCYSARFNTSTPSQEHKQDTGTSCKILSFFGGCGDTPWVLESLVGRNPTYPVALAPPDPDQTRHRGL